MRDSFGNELSIGDRILCIKEKHSERFRENQIGIIAGIEDSTAIIINYDLEAEGGWSDHSLGIEGKHGNYISLQQDTFIKVEERTDVTYREGDKVLCYCPIDNDKPFIGIVNSKEETTNSVYYTIEDSLGLEHSLVNNEILFLLERKQYEVGDEVIVQKSTNFELIFTEGYNQSIPARVDFVNGHHITIEIDTPSVGWQKNNDINHSYWTFTDTKRLLPREFSYSLPFVEYLKQHQSEIFTEQINSTEENGVISNEPRSRQPLPPSTIQLNSTERNRTVTPKLIHNYNYIPDETRFCRTEEEDDNENNLYLGIELEISGSSQESDNEEDAKEIQKVIQKDVEGADKSVYFKHDGSINGFEIVFHPHTIKAYNEYNWKEIFSTIKRLGYTNDDKKAGFHIHISRSYFGDETQQNEALAKMVFLMYKFKEEIEPLAGRKNSEYATYSAKALKRVKENDLFGTFRWYCDSCGKYSAINCQHKDTFEIRIFDGVTDKVRFMDILNFVENLCIIVKCTSITDITKVKLEDFMPFLYSIEG